MNRRERQRRRRRHRGHPLRRGLLVGVLVFVGTLGLAGLAAVGWVGSVAESAPSIDSLRPRDDGSVSAVYAANGQRLGFIQSDTLRLPVKDGGIPQVMRDA